MKSNLRWIVLGCAATISALSAEQTDSSKALGQMKALIGNWSGTFQWTGGRNDSGSMNATYYVTGNGSAVVENLINESTPVMTSVYHLDGRDLRMTHFCGAQNQPRLKARRIDLDHGAIDFDFVDATNLRSPDAPHVHGLEIRLIDANHLTLTFLFQSGRKLIMIKLRHLERRYPLGKEKFFYVLRDINLDIAEGEFVSVMGPSGAGKSTLLHILGMHDHGWEGEYSLNETAVHHLKPKERATLRNEQIGFVFQQYHLLDDLTVYENLEIPLSYRRYSKSERAALVADALDRFQIVGKKDLYPRQLSGGQQQLVGVARAIIADPKLLLADEPTGNLHSSQGEEIMELFRKLNDEGVTIVQVTHSDKNASYGKRVIQLRDGWIVNK
jgi:ABC-type lipoprotein export system ATPase subunit